MAHFDGAGANRVDGFKGRNDLTGAINLDAQTTTGHAGNIVSNDFRTGAEAREVLWPGGDHAPFFAALRDSGFREAGCGNCACSDAGHTGSLDKLTTFHR